MFLLSQNDENQSENGSKNSKIRLRARPPAEPQKKMLQTKKLRSKSWKTRGFFTFRLPILDGRVHEQVSSVLFFYSVFWRRASRPIKNRRFWSKNAPPPPPGKPVTFYECHPEDHAPAPSVRADLTSWETVSIHFGGLFWGSLIWWGCDHLCYTAKAEKANDLFLAPAGSVTWLIFAGRAPAVTCTHTDDRYVYMIYDTHTHTCWSVVSNNLHLWSNQLIADGQSADVQLDDNSWQF